jgi:glycosyltransferase involved in cell wall biosynthesis
MNKPEVDYTLPVSVITPAYNASRFLSRCIASVKSQGVECEYIIVDDFSTDNTVEAINRRGLKVDFSGTTSYLRWIKF